MLNEYDALTCTCNFPDGRSEDFVKLDAEDCALRAGTPSYTLRYKSTNPNTMQRMTAHSASFLGFHTHNIPTVNPCLPSQIPTHTTIEGRLYLLPIQQRPTNIFHYEKYHPHHKNDPMVPRHSRPPHASENHSYFP